MKQIISGAFILVFASCAGGGGTETDNPATLADFSSSACKTRAADPGQQAIVLESDAEGLQCVEWAKRSFGLTEHSVAQFPRAVR